MRSVITQAAHALVGSQTSMFTIEVQSEMVKRFARAVKAPQPADPLYSDEPYAKETKHGVLIAPPTFCTTLYWGLELVDRANAVLPPYRVAVNGSSDYEFVRPIRVGDVLTGISRLAELKERPFREETMLSVTLETEYRDLQGQLVLKARNTILQIYPPEGQDVKAPPRPAAPVPTRGAKPAHPQQRYWEDVQVGATVAPYTIAPGFVELCQFGGASDSYSIIHIDTESAKKLGLPGVVVPANLKLAYIANMLTLWMGDEGVMTSLSCQYRGMDLVTASMTAKGKVTGKRVQDGAHLVDLEVWVEGEKGQVTTPGKATVRLPKRLALP